MKSFIYITLPTQSMPQPYKSLVTIHLSFYFMFSKIYFLCMCVEGGVLGVCACNSKCPWRPKEVPRFPAAGVLGSCEPPSGNWESKLALLEEQYIQLTTEPHLQHLLVTFQEKMRLKEMKMQLGCSGSF